MQRKISAFIEIDGIIGLCGARKVFVGFAPASLLYSLSFADVLDEESSKGYQRRFNEQHSLEFRKYIRQPGATTIPLTFNLRPNKAKSWNLVVHKGNYAVLHIDPTSGPMLAQVDCQHRLGFMKDVSIPLAFMAFVGLTIREEMEVFSIINSKAKGLSSSLLDYHQSKLSEDLSTAKPEIYIALKLNDTPDSPWYRKLDLGGNSTVGMKRYASLRTMQKAVRRFLRESNILKSHTADEAFSVILSFWNAVTKVLPKAWSEPRKHFLTKGIGVYCLLSIAGDLYVEGTTKGLRCDTDYFAGVLSDFVTEFNWTTSGPLRGFGGAAGADQAVELLRKLRTPRRLRILANA